MVTPERSGDLAGSPGGFSRITGGGPHHRLADLECRYGRMLVFASDEVIGRSLVLYGEWAEHELRCLRPYIRPGSTVIDVGAYIGTHALPFFLWAGAGRVVADRGATCCEQCSHCELPKKRTVERTNN